MGVQELEARADGEIAAAVGAVWRSLERPGRWLTSAQRVAVAAECRAAAAVRRGADPSLTDHHRDLVATVVHDPASLQDEPLDAVLGPGTVIDEYVEVAAVAAKVIAIDLLCVGLELEPCRCPSPGRGAVAPAPRGAADLGARVPMLTAEGLAAELGPGTYHVNVRRGHSLVPEEAGLQIDLVNALYLPDLLDPSMPGRRGLARTQLEAIATRVSSLNRCFYCSAGHAQLLAMAGGDGPAPDLADAAAGRGDAGVAHGAELLALTEALVRRRSSLDAARAEAAGVLDDEQLLGAVATVAAFVLLNRVSDSSGIPLDDVARGLLAAVPTQVGLDAMPGSSR
ncbi:MAG: alkylhydroperoxidase-related (seleno)protein [Acidimicrobiales bacterium]